MIIAYISLWILKDYSYFKYLLHFSHLILTLSILDYILMLININVNLLRFIRYFLAMNIALLIGFFKYAQGVKTNIWQPTKRNE